MHGKPILISAASMSAFWPWLRAKFGFQRHPDPQIHLQSGAVHRGPQRHPGRLSHQRAFHGRAQAHFKPKVFLLADYGYPGYANMVLVPQKWIDTNRAAVQGFVDATARRLAELSERSARPAMR